jgi:hypothetical protein
MPWGAPGSGSGGYTSSGSWTGPGLLVIAWRWSARAARRYYAQLQVEASWVLRGLCVGWNAAFPFSGRSSAAAPERLTTSPDRPEQRN